MAEVSFEQAMQNIIKQAEDVSTNLSVKDKQKITKAGADVFKKELEREYTDNHYRDRKTGENPHLADSIISQNTNVDGKRTGDSTVGWTKDKAYIANFIENGSRFPMYSSKGHKFKHGGQTAINGDKAVERLRNDSRVIEKMREAEAKAYQKIVREK